MLIIDTDWIYGSDELSELYRSIHVCRAHYFHRHARSRYYFGDHTLEKILCDKIHCNTRLLYECLIFNTLFVYIFGEFTLIVSE